MSPENELELTRSLLRAEQVARQQEQKAAALTIATKDAIIAERDEKIRFYESGIDALVGGRS